jgi:hypothetical protein
MYCRVLNWMSTDVSEVGAARTSETSVNIQLRTRQYIPEDSELHTRRHENLKSLLKQIYWQAELAEDTVVCVDLELSDNCPIHLQVLVLCKHWSD